jgi:lipopolysaccharide/colanic/teichoic acid biosynthesis glycosyltransferase
MSIYAFRGFDNSTLKSLNSLVVAYSVGTILGVLFSLVIILFFSNKLDKLIFIITPLISAFAFPVIIKFLIKNGIKHMDEKRYLVIGNEEEFKSMLSEVEVESMGRIKIHKYINPSTLTLTNEITGERTFNNILIADPSLAETVDETLNKAKELGVSVEYLPNLVEEVLQRIPMKLIDAYKDYYKVVFSRVHLSYRKRVFDILISGFCLAILSPVYLIVSLIILSEDGCPAVFKQERVGLSNKSFVIHKFRTMYKKAEDSGAKYATDQNDNVLKVGKRIRPIRLDETPQFWDILIGKMSFIGPRPEQPCFAKELSEQLPYYNLRHRLKPGLSGWAQIKYRYAATLEEQEKKLSYDLYYIKNQTFMLDLNIILRTIETVIFKRGAK